MGIASRIEKLEAHVATQEEQIGDLFDALSQCAAKIEELRGQVVTTKRTGSASKSETKSAPEVKQSDPFDDIVTER